MEDHQQKRHSRRAFLRTAGSAGATLLAPSFLAACTNAPSTNAAVPPTVARALRIGVLLPRNARHATLGRQIYDGLQLALTQGNQTTGQFELISAHYTGPGDSLAQAQQLVADGRVDLLTGLMSRNHATALDGLLRERGVPAIISDIGANVIDQNDERGPFIRNSLNYWQANLALGEWAASQRGTRAVIATSLYEAGYDALHAFRYGFERQGGEIVATHVAASKADIGSLVAQLAGQQPELVYAAFSGQEAAAFLEAYAASSIASVPLVGPGFLVDEQLLAQHGQHAVGITSVMPWSQALDSTENRSFVHSFAAATGRAADECAALGYDTGRLLVGVCATNDLRNFAGLHDALEQATLVGPRGRLQFEPAFGEVTSQLYLREVQRTSGGYQNTVLANLGSSAAQHEHADALRRELRSGWTYPYLAV